MEGFNNTNGYTTDTFGFEKEFDQASFYIWLKDNWSQSLWYGAGYIFLVFLGRFYMQKRPKYSLRTPLAIWSSMLAIFSISGAIRTIPELLHVIQNKGFTGTLCDNSYLFGPTRFWAYLFVMSKLYELGDTVFIILRKQPLMFLHWYHHATVLVYTWFTVSEHTGPGRIFMVMNYTVHSIMYSYYALRAMGIRLPRFVSIVITTLQISQMIMGLVTVTTVYYIKSSGQICQQSWEDVYSCLLMYVSYLMLFSFFFYRSYLKPKNTKIN